jgi:hypothetical protein
MFNCWLGVLINLLLYLVSYVMCLYLYFTQDLGALMDTFRELFPVQLICADHVSESYDAVFHYLTSLCP